MTYHRSLFCGAAISLALLAVTPVSAQEQVASIDIAAQPMASALKELARQSGANVLFAPESVKGLKAPPIQTNATPEEAARRRRLHDREGRPGPPVRKRRRGRR